MQDRHAAPRDLEAAAHERADRAHLRTAQVHDDAAGFWHEHGDAEKAAHERDPGPDSAALEQRTTGAGDEAA
jgi:hypothetical protein